MKQQTTSNDSASSGTPSPMSGVQAWRGFGGEESGEGRINIDYRGYPDAIETYLQTLPGDITLTNSVPRHPPPLWNLIPGANGDEVQWNAFPWHWSE